MEQKISRTINIFFLIVLVFLLNIILERKEINIDNEAVVNESINTISMGVQWHAHIGEYYKDKGKIKYVACNESVAKVSGSGKITAISAGKTNILVKQKVNGEEKTIKNYVVTVNKARVWKECVKNFWISSQTEVSSHGEKKIKINENNNLIEYPNPKAKYIIYSNNDNLLKITKSGVIKYVKPNVTDKVILTIKENYKNKIYEIGKLYVKITPCL